MNEKKNLSKNELDNILAQVYSALAERGYDASSQIAGYILSEDPIYMPDWKDARGLIQQVDRDELLKLIIDYYLENRFEKNHEN